MDGKFIDELVFSLKGLSAYQIRHVLSLAYQDGGLLDASDRKFILQEKEQIIKNRRIGKKFIIPRQSVQNFIDEI